MRAQKQPRTRVWCCLVLDLLLLGIRRGGVYGLNSRSSLGLAISKVLEALKAQRQGWKPTAAQRRARQSAESGKLIVDLTPSN